MYLLHPLPDQSRKLSISLSLPTQVEGRQKETLLTKEANFIQLGEVLQLGGISMEHEKAVKEALNALYHHPDDTVRVQADRWLQNFQGTLDAWQASFFCF